MKLACTMASGRGDTDLVLHRVAIAMIASGFKPAGTAQINTGRADAGPCDMDVLVLPAGPVIRISQRLGPAAKGCRLDPSALETAVGIVQERLRQGADCLIVNKFGKHEAEGRGFRPVIADAVMRDLPVLVGLNAANAAAFQAFCGGLAERIDPDPLRLEAWLRSGVAAELQPSRVRIGKPFT